MAQLYESYFKQTPSFQLEEKHYFDELFGHQQYFSGCNESTATARDQQWDITSNKGKEHAETNCL